MKKPALAAAALILLLLTGCTGQPPSYDDTESRSQPESSVSRLESPVPESSTSSLLEGEESEAPVVSEPSETEIASAHSQAKTETQPQIESSKPNQEEQPTALSSQSITTQEEKKPTSQLEQQTTTAPSAPTVSETPVRPTPTQTDSPVFDVSAYVQFAKDYGTQAGLALDSSATDCWDDPLTANAGCRSLERDLKDRLDWYQQSGFKAFWVWAEQVAEGEYLIYIGYA